MPASTSPGNTEPLPAGRWRYALTGRVWRPQYLSAVLFVLSAVPAALLLWRIAHEQLGIDPLNAAIHVTGWWAMVLLLLTLCVTPLRRLSVVVTRAVALRWGRRLSDWNGLVRQRRQLGLWSFAYASVHMALYAALDAGSLHEVAADVAERPFIAWGLCGFLLLVPLAATSTKAAIRALKRNWSRLHMLVYPAAAAGLIHAWLQTKLGHPLPLGIAAAAIGLLCCRLWAWRAGDRSAAHEVRGR